MKNLEVGTPGPLLPESRFTGPTALCPHPERWRSTDADSTEREVAALLYGLVRALQPDAVLETGTGFGEAAELVSDALADNGHGHLYTIEFDAARVEYVRRRLRGTFGEEHATVVQGDTLAWTPPAGTVFDFCWFDSWYPNRVPEFERYRPFMRPGTIVGFHDTAPGHGQDGDIPGSDIRSAVAGLRSQARLIHLPTPRGVTLGEVLP